MGIIDSILAVVGFPFSMVAELVFYFFDVFVGSVFEDVVMTKSQMKDIHPPGKLSIGFPPIDSARTFRTPVSAICAYVFQSQFQVFNDCQLASLNHHYVLSTTVFSTPSRIGTDNASR